MRRTKAQIVAFSLLLVVPSAWAQEKTRPERDLLGEKQVPADANYGVQTAPALDNFQISGVTISHYPGFVEAWAIVKLAAARANLDVGAMKPEKLAAIEKACNAVIAGKYHDQFQVDCDMFRSSCGSTNWYSPFLWPESSSAMLASTSFAFMFVDVPAPP